jgi:hypothetical protein
MATAGSIVVDLLMRTGSFETDADRAGKKVKKLGKDSSDAAADVGKAFGKIAGAVVGGLAASGIAVLNWTRQLVDASVELERFAKLSGTTDQSFQRLAAGAATVGIQNDKLADIFKDTQDKLGDFLSTGGGAMKDFFEQIAPKVKLTADELRNLSGPDVLQKYYNALQKAGVSQADMVFYMEAIASDSAMLAPLLANNGEGFRKWGAEAERLGAVLDGETLTAMREVKEQSNQINLAFQGLKNQVASELLPQFRDLTAFLGSDQTRSAFTSITQWVAGITGEMANGIVMAVNYIDKLMELRGLDAGGALGDAGTQALNEQMAVVQRRLNLERSTTRGSFGLPLTQGQTEQREKRINDLIAERLRLQREITQRNLPKATLIDDGQMLPDSALKAMKNAAGSFRASVGSEDSKKVNQLADAFKSANEQMERQIALYGDSSELSRVNYEIQSGSLKGIDADMQAVVRTSASYLDILKSMDEVDAYQAEDAQKLADAFASMFGIDGESSTAAEAFFGQMSTFAEQAARNIQTYLGDSMFNILDGQFTSIGDSFVDMIKRMTAELAASQMLKMLSQGMSSYSGKGSGWINALGGLIGGARAGGGPVAGDNIYRVGEGGRPELFQQGGKSYLIPGDAGSVRPITAGLSASGPAGGGGGMQVIINNNAPAKVTTREQQSTGVNGDVFRQLIIDVAADDMANGGKIAQAGRGRFDWAERV